MRKGLGKDDLDSPENTCINRCHYWELMITGNTERSSFGIEQYEGEMSKIVKAKRRPHEEIVAAVFEDGMNKGDFKPNQNSPINGKALFWDV